MTNPDNATSGPASDAPAPPRKTVYVHEVAISTDAPTMTATELLLAARIEVGRYLCIERGDGVPEDRRIGDDEVVALRDGMRFYSVPLGVF